MKNRTNRRFLYISFMNEDLRPGYSHKIHSQTASLSRLAGEASLIIMCNLGIRVYTFLNGEIDSINGIALNNSKDSSDNAISLKDNNRSRTILGELTAFRHFKKEVIGFVKQHNIGTVYIRRIVPITPALISLLKQLKKIHVTIIYEYPTYPWKEEMRSGAKSILRKLFYLLDVSLYPSLIKIPDLITYVGNYDGNDNRFYRIQNCGSQEDYPLRDSKNNRKEIHLLGVAYVKWSHGYDLVIEGLKRYYENPFEQKVYFDIVGPTDQCPELKAMTMEYDLGRYVAFHGFKSGEDLENVVKLADIGVNVLRPRDNYEKSGMTSLKTVEYTFRGLPQISSSPFTIDRDKTDIPSFLKIIKGEVSIFEIVDFYNTLTVRPSDIRNYAIEHMSWDRVFYDVLNKIDELEENK